MAKPIANIPEWADASNGGNYTTGPYAGQPRKVNIPAALANEGFRPGAADPTAAEHFNDWLNQLSKWVTWLFGGTSAPDASAHLVETNATGRLAAQWGQFFASIAAVSYSLSSQNPTTSGNALRLYAEAPNADALISATHDNDGMFAQFEGGAGIALTCHGNGNRGVAITTDGTSAYGIEVTTSGSGATGIAVTCTGDGLQGVFASVDGAFAIGVRGVATEDGVGGSFRGGTVSGVGLIASGLVAEGFTCTGGTGPTVPALRSTGLVSAPGGLFTGGPSGADGAVGVATAGNFSGLRGEGPNRGVLGKTTNTSGTGVRGETAPAALAGSTAVRGVAQGAGTGGGFISVNGPAVAADSSLGSGIAGDFLADSGVGVKSVSQTGDAVFALSSSGRGGAFGSLTASAIYANSLSGAGVEAISSSGRGVSASSGSSVAVAASTTAGTTAALTATHSGNGPAATLVAAGNSPTAVIGARASNPATIIEGGLWTRQNQGLLAHIAKNGGAAAVRHLFDTAGGMCFGANFEDGPGVVDGLSPVVSVMLDGDNAPVAVGAILIVAAVEVGRTDPLDTQAVQLQVIVNGSAISLGTQNTFKMFQPGGVAVYERHIVYIVPHVLAAPGDQSIEVRLQSDPNGSDTAWRNAGLAVLGVF